ncbi:MAG TPA: CRISPR-associated endoribonuclease Cas6, partial [bacterium]|nr:CRISPR-associated endoribonuclease Cas6 [bacterium]
MMYSLVIRLGLEEDSVLPPYQGYLVYSMFLSLVRKHHADLAVSLHTPDAVKLFSLSQIIGPMRYHDGMLYLRADDSYYIRISILDSQSFAGVLDVFLRHGIERVRIGDVYFTVQEICTQPLAHQYAAYTSGEEIWSAASSADTALALKFMSPTAFKSGRESVVLPYPGLVFGSLAKKWQRCVPACPLAHLDYTRVLRIARYDALATSMLTFKKAKQIGFTGTVWYEVRDTDERTIKSLNALSDFAFYAGVGIKTAMGMGQTIRLGSGH